MISFIFIQLLPWPDWAMAAAGFLPLVPFSLPPHLFPSPTHNSPPRRGPAVIAGLPRVPLYLGEKTTQQNRTSTKPKDTQSPKPYCCPEGGPLLRPLPLSISHVGGPGPPSSPASSLSASPSRGEIVIICPTLVLRRKDRIALVALSSLNSKAILGALGCFHPQRFPTSFQSSWIWGCQASQFTKRWWRVCLSSRPHHQHLSDGSLCTLLHKWSPVAACPDRSW